MNEMSTASIVATAGQNNFISVFWLRCLSVQAFIPQGDSFCSPNCSSCLEIHGSFLAEERPIRGHVGHIKEINDTIR